MTDPLLDKTTGKLVEGRPELAKSDALPQRVLGYYVAAYKKRGARGGLNWYKQTRNNFEQCKGQCTTCLSIESSRAENLIVVLAS